MPQVTATLSNYRQSPRKVRRVADAVRGKKVSSALTELGFMTKRSGVPLQKLIKSAIANAKNLSIDSENLYLTKIEVNQGVTMKRFMPRARGRSAPIHKHSSHIRVVLNTEKPGKNNKQQTTNKKQQKTRENSAANN